jgi:hypothetical protein
MCTAPAQTKRLQRNFHSNIVRQKEFRRTAAAARGTASASGHHASETYNGRTVVKAPALRRGRGVFGRPDEPTGRRRLRVPGSPIGYQTGVAAPRDPCTWPGACRLSCCTTRQLLAGAGPHESTVVRGQSWSGKDAERWKS